MTKYDDPTSQASPSHDTQLDELLREAYEPTPGAAGRVARAALAETRIDSAEPVPPRPWVLALAAALLLGAAAWLVRPLVMPDPASTGVASRSAARAASPSVFQPTTTRSAEPRTDAQAQARAQAQELDPLASSLRITGDGGGVTVTTAGGTRWIALPSANPSSGDPSS